VTISCTFFSTYLPRFPASTCSRRAPSQPAVSCCCLSNVSETTNERRAVCRRRRRRCVIIPSTYRVDHLRCFMMHPALSTLHDKQWAPGREFRPELAPGREFRPELGWAGRSKYCTGKYDGRCCTRNLADDR